MGMADIRRFQLRCGALEDRVAPATFTVTNLLDTGAGSLRTAIATAQSKVNPGHDFIVFDAGFFNIARTITLASNLSIIDDLTITGPNAPLAISGGGVTRVFEINGAGTVVVAMSKLRISNGNVAGAGAGILSQAESLTLIDCTISSNTATGGFSGGGVSSLNGGTLSLTRCTVISNSAAGNGGGVDANGSATVTLTDCSMTNNRATGSGGGVGIGTSSLKIERSTLSTNTANNGGGLYFAGTVGVAGVILRNSTFSANKALANGGAVAFINVSGTPLVQNSTLTANSAAAQGGGIARLGGSTFPFLESSIVQGNTGAIGADVFSAGTVPAKNCALGSTAGIGTFDNQGGNLIGVNIHLSSLLNNGGTTQTHALLDNSPCIDAGSDPAGLSVDQRGPGFSRAIGGLPDIGAFENHAMIVRNANDAGPGTLRQAVADANNTGGVNVITFEPSAFASPQIITLTLGELLITDAVTIIGPGQGLATISGNNASRVFNLNAPLAVFMNISGVTIANGKASGRGGGILNQAEFLTLTNCVIADNEAVGAGAAGGGVSSPGGGSITMVNCRVTGNSAGQNGGGIDGNSNVIMDIRDCTIADNSAGGSGGGIGVATNAFALERCTLSGNSAAGGGGALYLIDGSAGASVTLRNITVSHNTAQGSGGGLYLQVASGTEKIYNSTLVGNTAAKGGGGFRHRRHRQRRARKHHRTGQRRAQRSRHFNTQRRLGEDVGPRFNRRHHDLHQPWRQFGIQFRSQARAPGRQRRADADAPASPR